MKKHISGLLFCLATWLGLQAQSTFIEGYIINQSNDTLPGLIHRDGLNATSNKCTYKADSLAESMTYTPQDIAGYGFRNSKQFRSKNILLNKQATPRFAECLLDGVLNLYLVQGLGFEKRYLLEKGKQLFELTNEKITYTEGGTQYEKRSELYKGTLKYIMQDAPELHASIDGLFFRNNAMVRIVSQYHKKTSPSEPLTDFYNTRQKAESSWRLQLGPAAGFGLTGIKNKGGLKFSGQDINRTGDGLYSAEFYSSDYYQGFGYTRHSESNTALIPAFVIALEQNNTHALQLEFLYQQQNFTLGENTLKFSSLSIPVSYRRTFLEQRALRPYIDLGIVANLYQSVNFLDSIRVDYGEPTIDMYNDVYHTPVTQYEKRPKNELGISSTLGIFMGAGVRYEVHRNGYLMLECQGYMAYMKDKHTTQEVLYSVFELYHYGVQLQLSYVYSFEL